MAAIEDNPSIPMAEIRDLVGMSTKQLIAVFRAEVGLSPKAYARVRRFQMALGLLKRGRGGRCSRGGIGMIGVWTTPNER
jgi:methylphosphotriester-DNA--protein-cysteine methyltransferase